MGFVLGHFQQASIVRLGMVYILDVIYLSLFFLFTLLIKRIFFLSGLHSYFTSTAVSLFMRFL